jgi:type IV secretion system protein VirB6
MGFIESIFSQIETFLTNVGASQFAAVAEAFGNTGSLVATLAVLLIIINMGVQAVPVDRVEALTLLFRITLVGLFMQSWPQFNNVMSALQNMFGGMEAAMLGAAFENSNITSFAKALDDLGKNMAAFANQTSGGLNIMGAVINGIMMLFIALFSAICALGMIVSRLGLAVLIALAPLAILTTLLRVTGDYFSQWLSAVVTMLLFPVVLAGVFASVIAMGNATIAGLDSESTTTLGQVIPVLSVIVMGIVMVLIVPFLVGLITGNFQLGNLTRSIQNNVFGAARGASIFAGRLGARGIGAAAGAARAASTNAGAAANAGPAVQAARAQRVTTRTDRSRRR